MYGEFQPAVVLLDLKMPGIDGMEVMEIVTLKRRVKQLEDQLEETYGFENIVGILVCPETPALAGYPQVPGASGK